MLPQEIIRHKRDGKTLDADAIAAFIAGLTDGNVSEGQAAAFAMAVFLNGMNRDEAVALTLAMRDSGDVLAWPEIDRPVIDKHSTGGVGDNVSLMLAPIAAACGLAVPMISGRGLAHTGGTLDKLESIPGYTVTPSNAKFRQIVKEVGCAIIGQTGDLAPADKRLYAIRDVTATVESIPLITASILSKKLAAGLSGLVLDVKCGSGAFMGTTSAARDLARALVDVANGAGMPTSALLTDMSAPLASAAGNAVEVANAVEFLTGTKQDARLRDVTLALAAEMLLAGGVVESVSAGAEKARQALDDGSAAEHFQRMVAALGGPADFLSDYRRHLPQAPIIDIVAAPEDGYITGYQTREIGMAVVSLGGGRHQPQDSVDPAVGLTGLLPVGSRVERGEPLCSILARNPADLDAARQRVRKAITLQDTPCEAHPVILERLE
ncbi:thymidine phosphorylase [Pseudohoeflea coraliihabitans]|uniref:Thymidine phosphorylase n=1 Tax=Pseudohoeflea coraliihabitans TaxID=2860393 RepID=A0ABS6WPB7_9HYPH|nr:thymidine phosphorylase [Pseudohoeflea sp. DP4N28-3]